MKQLINSIVFATMAATANLQAGDVTTVSGPVVEQVSESPLWAGQTFAQCLVQDDSETFGFGLSLQTQVLNQTYLEVVGVAAEDDVFTLGANVAYHLVEESSDSPVGVYAIAGTNYNFDVEEWSLSAGGGLSLTLTTNLSAFADAAYVFSVSDTDKDGGAVIRGGLNYKF